MLPRQSYLRTATRSPETIPGVILLSGEALQALEPHRTNTTRDAHEHVAHRINGLAARRNDDFEGTNSEDLGRAFYSLYRWAV
jgi:hypothetical protein